MKFMWEQNEMVDRWAEWAEQQVAGWSDDITLPDGPQVGEFLAAAAAEGKVVAVKRQLHHGDGAG
jgi:hypothetical protein